MTVLGFVVGILRSESEIGACNFDWRGGSRTCGPGRTIWSVRKPSDTLYVVVCASLNFSIHDEDFVVVGRVVRAIIHY